ncbi:hypothetical protein HZA97_00025 [Candidatus Woesearchaeota archaeon]|nr:hypothetical protein [Candidatus Woesearchaeota archaeon]
MLSNQGKIGRPLTYPNNLAKAVLLCEELGFTERNAQGWLKTLRKPVNTGSALLIEEKTTNLTEDQHGKICT